MFFKIKYLLNVKSGLSGEIVLQHAFYMNIQLASFFRGESETPNYMFCFKIENANFENDERRKNVKCNKQLM